MDEIDNWIDPLLEINKSHAEGIGSFMINWGCLEHTIDLLFPIVFRIDPTLSLCISANLGTKAKIEMLQSALTMLSPILPLDQLSTIQECLKQALAYSTKHRNFIAHGRPIFTTPVNGEISWSWGRFAARKQLTMFIPDDEHEI